MGVYTNRTCANCGIRKPQPEMHSIETYAEVAKSVQGVSTATFVGSLVFNNRKSDSAIGNWLFNNNQRTYKRKKRVWMCGSCAGFNRKGSFIGKIFRGFFYFLLFLIIFAAIVGQSSN